MSDKKEKLIDAIGKIDDNYVDQAHKSKFKKLVFDWSLVGKVLTCALCLFIVVTIIPKLFNYKSYASDQTAETAKLDGAMIYDNGYGYNLKGAEPSSKLSKTLANDTISEADEEDSLTDNKKLIVTGNINVETMNFDDLLNKINTYTSEFGGYVQNSSISTNPDQTRYYNATIRIPADKYDEFLGKTKENGNVTYYSENVEDITDTYSDLQAHVNSLKAEEKKVLEFYDKATNLEELMSVESRLTDIRYQIDYMETRIKNYDLLINYSTLNITIIETVAYTITDDSFFSKLGLSFKNGFTNFINSIENIIVDFVYNIWGFILLAIIVVVAIVVGKKIFKNKKK